MKPYPAAAIATRQRSGRLERWHALATGRRAGLEFIAQTLYVFLFVYNISFVWVPSATTGRVVLLLLTVWHWPRVAKELRRFAGEQGPWLVAFVCVLVYSVLLYAVSGFVDSTQVSRALHFLLYVIAGSVVFAVAVNHDVRRFADSFALATLVQAALIGLSYVSADYRLWLSQIVVQGGNIPLTNGIQVPGFTNSSGALLSVLQALGVFAALYSAKLANNTRASSFWVCASLVIAVSTIVTGRTGLLLAVIFMGAFLLVGRLKQRLALVSLAVMLAVGVLFSASSLSSVLAEVNPQFENLSGWAFEIFQRGADAGSWQDLLSQPVPPLTFDRLLGTGLVVAQNGIGNESGNDSGYVQTYFVLGLIMALVLYAAVLGMLGKLIWQSQERFLFGVLLVLLFVIEFKEPFIYKYTYPFLILTIAALSKRRPNFATHARQQNGQRSQPAPL